ncbi:MAG: hypothetical protein L7W39_06665 [Alphaproteobacteria bacterium]|nr:hypothetical protein [Alphaproteobacteria bacterium]
MEMTSQNISSDHKLINFNVPNYLIKNFDNLVKLKRVSRTSMLVQLMETYCRSEQRRLKEDNILNQMVVDLTQRNKKELKEEVKKEITDEYEPPLIPYTSDDEWEDRLLRL